MHYLQCITYLLLISTSKQQPRTMCYFTVCMSCVFESDLVGWFWLGCSQGVLGKSHSCRHPKIWLRLLYLLPKGPLTWLLSRACRSSPAVGMRPHYLAIWACPLRYLIVTPKQVICEKEEGPQRLSQPGQSLKSPHRQACLNSRC